MSEIREDSPNREATLAMSDGAAGIIVAVAVLAGVGYLGYELVTRGLATAKGVEGVRACRNELARRPEAANRDSFTVIRTVWTREIAGKQVAALVLQPKNLHNEQLVTVVCYFPAKRRVAVDPPIEDPVESIEYLAGDRADAVKNISRSPFAFVGDLWLWGFQDDSAQATKAVPTPTGRR